MTVFLNEILVHIFDYLDALSLTKVCTVCKQWENVSKTPRLWRRLVIQKWPSQNFLYLNVPLTCTNWLKVYQDLYFRGKFSPDDQRYFICCRVGEDELEADELRSAMMAQMTKVTKKWTIAEPFEADDNRNFPIFNCNFDFYYDTHDFKWKFIDKRQEYIEDLMGYKLSSKLQRKSRFIRPYQVMPSCLLLYRWLSLFRSMGSDEHGLTFYRIWRYHLKHKDSGLLFEVCDWKAAMSCSFLKGKPSAGTYMDDCLDLMNVLSHPHFIMHPQGLPHGVFRFASLLSPQVGISRQASVSSLISNSPRSLAGSTNTLDSKLSDSKVWLWTLSGTDSDDESLVNDDSGYYSNCEYFISVSHWDIEEQHTIQTSVAESWTFGQLTDKPQLYLSFDAVEENWYFYSYGYDTKETGNDPSTLTENMSKHILVNSEFHGLNTEPIPSCLALYRLICLFDLVNHNYSCLEESSLWSIMLTHNATGSFLCLKDKNGWFEISAYLTDELMNDLKRTQLTTIKPQETHNQPPTDNQFEAIEIEPTDWNNAYDGDDDSYDDDNEHDLETLGSSPEDRNMDELLHLDLSNESVRDHNMVDVPNIELPPENARDWYHNEVESIEDLGEAFEPHIELPPENGRRWYRNGEEIIEDQGGAFEPLPMIENSKLDSFKSDVVTLLNLLLSEKFGHPYGTIAGCVA